MAAAPVTRRLAGIEFEAQPPPSPDVLPRMDITGFVGFAAAGPIGVPVPVEDTAEFEAIFGRDAPLAWDAVRGEQVNAQLAPAVRAFFRNGGRRAWIVRVAGPGARQTLFPAPNLICNRADRLSAAVLPARAAGSWSDGLLVETALASRPAAIVTASANRLLFRLEVPAGDAIVPGDLLRVRAEPYELLVAVASVEQAPVVRSAIDPARTVLKVKGLHRSALWLERRTPPAGASGEARLVGEDGHGRFAPATVLAGRAVDRAELEVSAEPKLSPALGLLVSVDFDDQALPRQLFLEVEEVRTAGTRFRVAGPAFWVLRGMPEPRPQLGGEDAVERLTVELRVRRGSERWSLADLGLAPGHPRYLGDLPTDEELYAPQEGEFVSDEEPRQFWAEAAKPRFPLAGRDLVSRGIYYPLGMSAAFGKALGAQRLPGTALGRDGLARFDDSLFLDPALRARRFDTVLATADYVRWQSPRPRRLSGIHALLGLDEVTIVAVPDAVHRGWKKRRAPRPPRPAASEPASRERRKPFDDCAKRVLQPRPTLSATLPDRTGSFRLEWDASDERDAQYVVQESADPQSWDDAHTIYEGRATELDVYARPRGTYVYRVRVEAGGNVSDWSGGQVVQVEPPSRWQVRREENYRPGMLLAVQRALLRMCCARGDLVCVLSVPEHYRDDAAIAHTDALRAAYDQRAPEAASSRLDRVEKLDASEAKALGYGALYHPWLTSSVPDAPDRFVRTPADGAAAGVLAVRAATRGAWVAPANVVLRDVVTLTPAVDRRALGPLQQAQVNEVRQEPDGFLWLSADTLADDPDLRPLNVRRLLALLRRLVLLRGVDYVFEPNSDVFRRSVQRGFEATMMQLFVLGAFAGTTPDEAFRVEVGSPPNTRQTLDAGQLIVELKIAPSRPLVFLTIRLVGDAERGFREEVR